MSTSIFITGGGGSPLPLNTSLWIRLRCIQLEVDDCFYVRNGPVFSDKVALTELMLHSAKPCKGKGSFCSLFCRSDGEWAATELHHGNY